MEHEKIVQKVWGLCHILRGDGIGYHQYVSELSYLLFLKIAEESETEDLLPKGFRWKDLFSFEGEDLLTFYQKMLTHLGEHAKSEVVRAIYSFPTTVFSHSENLRGVIDGIAGINWHSISRDSIGDIYEGLIEKSSQDVRSGAGQYFTPRPVVDSMVKLTKPALGELIQDPATGSGGFLVSADQYIKSNSSKSEYLANPPSYQGVEIEKNTRRICLMNTFLNQLDAEIVFGDALTDDVKKIRKADLILANPPFGNKAGSKRRARQDIPYPNVNKQYAFLQHIYLGLKDGGRAAVLLPDNILFEEGVGTKIRQELMEQCDLHTILRLPNGIFYSAGVNTNVLFFTKRSPKKNNSNNIWFYDLRTNMPNFGKTRPFTHDHLEDFESCFGGRADGRSPRKPSNLHDRFRKVTRKEISDRGDNLDIFWLDNKANAENLEFIEPMDIVSTIIQKLNSALLEMEAFSEELESTHDIENLSND